MNNMTSLMRRYYPRPLSTLFFSVSPTSSSAQYSVASGSTCSPKYQRCNLRWWECNQKSFPGNLYTTGAISENSTSKQTISSSEGDGNVCRLFREIGSRTESDRKASPTAAISPPSESVSNRKSAASLTSDFCKAYLSLPDKNPSSSEYDPKLELIELLLHEKYDVDQQSIMSAINNVRSRSLRNADIHRIRELCTPQYESIFHCILGSAQEDLGVAFLVQLRRDLRDVIHYRKFVQKKEGKEDDEGQPRISKGQMHSLQLTKLQTLERSMKAILTSLFRPGVLHLQRITYEETPASIIEQIAFKEAVHPLQSLQDLRTRLGPGRRCFAFFHPALPNKPLVFVHVALLKDMPKGMSDLQYATESNDSKCATFYSITNTEPGLSGVDLGNHLIKSVVQVLQNDFANLDTFCTLSPIPKFRKWLEGKIVRYHEGLLRKQHVNQNSEDSSSGVSLKFMDDGLFDPTELQQLQDIFSSESSLLDLLETLKSPTWHTSTSESNGNDGKDSASALADQLQPLLMKLAAYYLTIETHHGRPLCPVAKFHIRNGAEMYRLNYMADCSAKGIRQSCGMMINYHYSLDDIEENRVRYEINGNVMVKDGVKCWLNGSGK